MLDKKINKNIALIIILIIGLSISTFALVYNRVSVKDNIFKTGGVNININDGNPVIEESEFLFEPGMTVEEPFFIKNNSSIAVYYKIYFDKVIGDLKDIIEVTIKDKDTNTILCKDKLANITDANTLAYEDILEINETKEFIIYFYYPTSSNNDSQGKSLSFELYVKATQTKNNEERLFNN